MQIRDPRHKRRLIIKATDIVLFGPPQRILFNLSHSKNNSLFI